MTDKGKHLKQMLEQLNEEVRKLERLAAQFDRNAIWEVYETNADLMQLKLVHQGFDKDIAESKMVALFTKSGYEQDYMLYNRATQQCMSLLFSERTKQLRGECQG